MVKCPFYEYEASEGSFRALREPWRFRFYTIRMLECPACRNIFNYYRGVSSKGRASEFVVRVKPRRG